MAQHDYNIANQTGANFRADLNNALAAIATVNSGATQPSTTFAHQLWVDTSSSQLKIRNAADNAWITTGVSITASNTFTGNLTGTVSSLSNHNTNNLSEGSSNLYYTDARARASISATGDISYNNSTGVISFTGSTPVTSVNTQTGDVVLDTDDIGEGSSNLYFTTARANSNFDTRLATKDTGNLSEGSNLYFTNARARASISEGSTQLSYNSTTGVLTYTQGNTDTVSEGSNNLYYTQARFNSAFSNKTTANLTENTNLYYTDTRANSAIDARVTKAFVDALGIQATSVADNSVVLGNDTTGNYIQTVTGTANKITVSGSGSESADITLSLPDNVQIADSLTVAGNLTVNGTLVSLDTTNLDIEDNLFQLNAGLTGSPVNDSGMLINRGNQDNGIIMWDESVDKFTMGLTTADGSATGNITLSSLGTLVANLEGAVTGNVTGQVSDISNFTTANLTENTNLYYTQARFDSAFSGKSTSDLSEGSNLYYTDARVQAVSINNVVEDTTPQLGGNLDVNGNDIVTTSNGAINLDPNGSGVVVFKGNATKGSGQFKLNCENNSHGITIKAPPHSAAATYTLTLPNDDGNANQVLTTDGSGNLSWSTPSSGGSTTLLGLTDVGSDGTNGQVLTTNGSGSFTFTTVSGGSYSNADVDAHLNRSTASSGEVLSWNGSDYDWVAQSGGGSLNGSYSTNIFTATSGQTAFTLSNSVSNENNLMVFVDGVFQAQNTYSTSGTTLTFATGIVLNRVVTVYHIETATTVTPSDNTVSTAKIVDDAVTSAKLDTNLAVAGTLDVAGAVDVGNLTVNSTQGTDGQVLTSTGTGVAWEDASGGGGGSSIVFKTFGTDSIMVGDNATGTISSANYNTGLGVGVFANLTSGDENVVIGYQSGNSLTTRSDNVLIGFKAGRVSNGSQNVYIGSQAGENAVEGKGIFIGRRAGEHNTGWTDGDVAVGYMAMRYKNNTAYSADNVAIGRSALAGNSSTLNASRNVAVGANSLQSVTTGIQNTGVGFYAASGLTTGDYNFGLGSNSIQYTTTGNGNIGIGRSAGDTITTGSFNTLIGYNTDVSSSSASNQIAMGYEVTSVGNNNFTFGNSGTDSNIAFGATSITAPSDVRLKEDIQDEEVGLDFINDLRPVTFQWKKEKDIPSDMKAYKEGSEERTMNGKYNHGFIAQEVKEVIDNHNLKEGFDMWAEDEADGRQRVAPNALMSVMVKAVQELSATVDELKAEIQTLKQE